MNLQTPDVTDQESALVELLEKIQLSEQDGISISYLLAGILTKYFSSTEKETGLRSWSIDDMYPDTIHRTNKKLTLVGSINWLGGGGICKRYQADIAIDTNPILYSIKLQNKHGHQILYVGRTHTGWVLNST